MKTLEEIALQVADSIQFSTTKPFTCDQIEEFARRLVAALGAQEPVGFVYEKTLSAILKSKEACIRDTQIQNGSPLYAAPVVNPDWQMVPKEPTPEMIVAAKNLDWGNSDVEGSCINQWHVMLSAAPEYGK